MMTLILLSIVLGRSPKVRQYVRERFPFIDQLLKKHEKA